MRGRCFALLLAVVAGCGGDDGGRRDIDAGATMDAGTADAGTMGVACGGGTVCLGPEVCCGSLDQQSCTAEAQCQDVVLRCDDPTDCGGGDEGCCLTAEGSACAAKDSCSGALYCVTADDCNGGSCGQLGLCVP